MTDFGRSATGPTLTDISSVASNASNITTVAGSMQDVQDVAAEINDTPSLRSLMNSVLNDTVSLTGLSDTSLGTLGLSEQGYQLTWVWDTNTSSGNWQAQPGSDVVVNGTVSSGNGLKYNTGGYYEDANFLEIGSADTISTNQISNIQDPSGANQLAHTNNASQVVFASTIPGNYTFDGDITFNGDIIAHGNGSSEAGLVQFNCWNNNHYVSLEGPVHVSGTTDNMVLRLPQSAPSTAGQALTVKGTPSTAGSVTTAELEFTQPATPGFAIAMSIVF